MGRFTWGGALPDGLHRGHQRYAPGYIYVAPLGLLVSLIRLIRIRRVGRWVGHRMKFELGLKIINGGVQLGVVAFEGGVGQVIDDEIGRAHV